ncbi:MAG: translesion error-prone DNA polymerase V autoproteolytic subunit [Flavobacteriales bacterium]|nr:translesion error-prone DNA polymerase V autoproteolytic subunit [Flavobacteriales bacterium]
MRNYRVYKHKELLFYSTKDSNWNSVPFYEASVSAGFPSPAEDFMDLELNLQDYLIQHPSATFCVRVTGDSMIKAGISSGDVMIVDRSLETKDGNIVLAVLNGEFTVKRIKKNKDQLLLIPENTKFDPIIVSEEMDFKVWGVVTHVVHQLI